MRKSDPPPDSPELAPSNVFPNVKKIIEGYQVPSVEDVKTAALTFGFKSHGPQFYTGGLKGWHKHMQFIDLDGANVENKHHFFLTVFFP